MAVIGIVGVFTLGWLSGLYALDRNRRRKRTGWEIPAMVTAGMLSVIPTLWLYDINPLERAASFGPFAYHFAFVGLTEEIAKFGVFVIVARLLRTIREPHDGIVQGAALGVGFSAVEDVVYGISSGPEVALLRSVFIGVHAIAGALMGYIWAAAVYENAMHRAPERYRLAIGGVVLVAIAHSVYNSVWTWFAVDVGLLVNATLQVGLILAAACAYQSMLRRSPYHDFPFSESREAVRLIAAGLRRDPGNVTLLRRLAIYAIAAERYAVALDALRRIRPRVKGTTRSTIDVLAGVAQWCAGETADGERAIATAVEPLSAGARRRLADQAARLLGDRAKAKRVSLVILPIEERLRIPSERHRTSNSLRETSAPRTTSPRRRRYSSSRSGCEPAARSAAQSA